MVVTDDLSLSTGKLRLKGKGSDGGHNGLKSIQQALNTTNYNRLRFGIGNDFKKGSQTDYVLENWSDEESRSLSKHIDHNIDIIFHFIKHGVENTMNKYN